MEAEPISLVATLVEAGGIDTVYRDLYLGRARTLLSPLMSLEDFHHSEQRQRGLAELPLAVARALEKGDWPQVKELSLRADALRQAVADEATRFETARGVYAVTEVTLDPFCQSLQKFTQVAAKNLPALRTEIVEKLARLETSDVPWRDFYAGRRTAFQDASPGRRRAGDGREGRAHLGRERPASGGRCAEVRRYEARGTTGRPHADRHVRRR